MINICEVGLRDGLQNEKTFITTEQKVALISKLIDAGIKKFEAVSFVNPKVIPQMADAEEVIKQAPKIEGISYAGLVLSHSGLERALNTEVDTLHIVMATSNKFNMKNARRTIDQSVTELTTVTSEAIAENKKVTATLGTAFGCPFEGDIPLNRILEISKSFIQSGATSITLADTTGLANPQQVAHTIKEFNHQFGHSIELGLHFHNTRGLGLANVLSGYLNGVKNFDSSIGGLGGCPFAPKAVGNVCTEDMVNMFHEMSINSGTNLEKLVDSAKWLENVMDKKLDGMLMKIM